MNETITAEQIDSVVKFADRAVCLWNYHESWEPAVKAAVAAGKLAFFDVMVSDYVYCLWGYYSNVDEMGRRVRHVVHHALRGIERDRKQGWGRTARTSERRREALRVIRAYRKAMAAYSAAH